jgi:DNA-binding MarR family transcriptional regulator/GNAT superfamily N-acetyltransferase
MTTTPEQPVEAVRRFNRFYTRQIGVLNEKLLDSPFTLVEVRVMYELAHRQAPTATEIAKVLGLDAGYLSRILRAFKKRGLIDRKASAADGRLGLLSLTAEGRKAFAALNARSHDEISAALTTLSGEDQQRLLRAMHTIESVVGGPQEGKVPYLLRPPQPGDMGWVIHRHGVLYAEEYGWDEHFEGLVAEIVAQFVREFDRRGERCWIAEREGEVVGSVFLVKASDDIAKLRLLLVEPQARGLGIGRRLVAECIRFARHAGYKKLTLWTNDVLAAARRIYQDAGFQLVHEEPHRSYGHDLVAQTWELAL